MSAKAAVLGTAELLEAIILQLPLPTILRVQGINTRFRDVIKDSPEIQKALFLRPTIDRPLRLNRALERHLAVDCKNYAQCPKNGPEPLRQLSQLGGWNRDGNDEWPLNILINPCLPKLERAHYITLPKRCSSHDSWRRVLLTQPPIQEMVVTDESGPHWHVVRAAEGARGLTLNDLQQHFMAFKCCIVHYFPARGIGRVDQQPSQTTAFIVISELTRKANCGEIEDGFNDYQPHKAEMDRDTISFPELEIPEFLRGFSYPQEP